MVDQNLTMLCGAAITIALLHTLCGPDHYIPFVAMSRAGKWSLRWTMFITLVSGLGHVGGSILLGCIGIAAGEVLARMELIEATRGRLVGWSLALFGFGYLVWGLFYGLRNRPHVHIHGGQTFYHHPHAHDQNSESAHCELTATETPPHPAGRLTPWVLLTIFVFGPCEPLIPLLMYPAAQSSIFGIVLVSVLFSITTIATMLAMVFCLVHGTRFVQFPRLQLYSHALAGMVVMLCGIAINFGL